MTGAQAQFLAGKLAAAFPRDWAFTGEATNAVYVEKFAGLDRFEAARDAVDDLIATELRLPPVALIRDAYRRYWDRYSPPALEEGEISESDRDANIRRMRYLTDHLAAQGENGHTRDFETCTQPGCVELRTLAVPTVRQD